MFPSHLTFPVFVAECNTLHLPKPELSACAQMLPMGSTEMLAPHRETQSRSTFQFCLRESNHFNDLHVSCTLDPGGTLTPPKSSPIPIQFLATVYTMSSVLPSHSTFSPPCPSSPRSQDTAVTPDKSYQGTHCNSSPKSAHSI